VKTKITSSNSKGNNRGEYSEETDYQRRTITRTFRIYEELSDSFEQVVSGMNATQTGLMNEILKQYLAWAQFIINHESPFLTFDSSTFLALIEKVDDENLEKIVKDISNEAAIDFIKFRWKKVNFRNIVRYLELLSSYANIGNFKIGPLDGNGNGNGHSNDFKDSEKALNGNFEKYEIAIRHHLGKRWSIFLGMYISNLFASSISGAETNYEASSKSCFVYVNLTMK
jgi:hypothetical protein